MRSLLSWLAAVLFLLYGRAGDSSVGAEDTAVTRFWLEDRTATLAFVEPLAGICRHCLCFAVLTEGTGDRRL